LPLADRAIGNLQQWLIALIHGVSRAQLQVYLDEFVFDTIGGSNLWPPFRRCSVSERAHATPYRRIRGARDLLKPSDYP